MKIIWDPRKNSVVSEIVLYWGALYQGPTVIGLLATFGESQYCIFWSEPLLTRLSDKIHRGHIIGPTFLTSRISMFLGPGLSAVAARALSINSANAYAETVFQTHNLNPDLHFQITVYFLYHRMSIHTNKNKLPDCY